MRDLTGRERAVLAHIVVDADAWWAHVNSDSVRVDAEAALTEKVARWAPDHDAAEAAATSGAPYQTRAQRDAELL